MVSNVAKHSNSPRSPSVSADANKTISSLRNSAAAPSGASTTASHTGSGRDARGTLSSYAGSIFVDETEFPTWED